MKWISHVQSSVTPSSTDWADW